MTNRDNEEYENPIDKLYDENNCDPIYLFNEKGETIGFEQIAIIPKQDNTYVILKPIQPMDGLGENEGLVFSIKENDDGQEYLELVIDETVIDEVFEVYDRLVEEDDD